MSALNEMLSGLDSGQVTTPAAVGTNVLQDTTKNWAADVHRNRLVKIVKESTVFQTRVIQGNSNNTLLIVGAWSYAIPAGAGYVILDVDIRQILRDVLGGGGDISAANPLQVFDPKVFGAVGGLVLSGTVTDVPGANQFTIPTLAGLGAGKFADATAPYRAFVVRDAGGVGGAPQGEMQAITAYATLTGIFTAPGFGGGGIAIDDEVLILHPRLAEIFDILTNLGPMNVAATADDLSNVTTTSAQAKLRRVLLRMSGAGIFSADIQGVARTELDTMLAQVATYFVAAGAAMALQVNGNAARTNLQQALTDFFAVFGADGANVFNPTINNAAQLNLENALSAVNDILISAAGITAWLARALPANGVSLSEAVRYTAELKPQFSTPVVGNHTTPSFPAEDTAFTTAAIGPGLLYCVVDIAALVANDDVTFRVYQSVFGATYRLLSEQQIIGPPTRTVYTIDGIYVDATAHIQLRTLKTAATGNRTLPYRYSIHQQPVA